jgi:hypothetical protein
MPLSVRYRPVRADGTSLPPKDVPEGEFERSLPTTSPFQRWLLFEANRWLVALPLLFAIFFTFFALGRSGLLDYHYESTATLLLSVLIGGNFTLVAIVVTINQLVLSREFGKPHTLRERNQGILQFRGDVEEIIGTDVAPEDPLEFLREIVGALADRGERLRRLADDAAPLDEAGGARVEDDVDAYADAIRESTDELDDVLRQSEFGNFDVLVAMLFYRIAWQIHANRRISARHADVLPDAAAGVLDDIEQLLLHFNVGRQYVQTLYMQKELAELSRLLLYFGVPSLIVMSFAMLVYSEGPAITIGARNLTLAISVAAASGFVPLAILLSYMIRISTIVSRMPLLNPFISDG